MKLFRYSLLSCKWLNYIRKKRAKNILEKKERKMEIKYRQIQKEEYPESENIIREAF